jgi:hypothetical protein
MISFNGDEVDCTLDREVVEEIVKLLFFVVDEIIGVGWVLLTSFADEKVVLEFDIAFV